MFKKTYFNVSFVDPWLLANTSAIDSFVASFTASFAIKMIPSQLGGH